MTQITDIQNSAYIDEARTDCLRATLDFERELADRKCLPYIDRLPHIRSRPLFEVIAAILLALGVSGMSLLGNFVVFNKILHWTF